MSVVVYDIELNTAKHLSQDMKGQQTQEFAA